jgi:5-methylthioadenosine/S-adenosylhomocysteine deaminase
VLAAEWTLVPAPGGPRLRPGLAVRVRGGRIAGVTPRAALPPDAPVEALPGQALLPGLVNAHQHGRGVSQLLLGLPDDALEPWIARRLGRPAPDVGAISALAAHEMARHGTTACVHANYSHGGDYEAEARAALAAYDASGLRVTFCVGAQDRGRLLYPPGDEAPVRAALPPAAVGLLDARGPAYAGGAEGTRALMDRLLADWGGHPRITLAYGPANPLWVGDTLMRSLAEDAERRGIGLHMHVAESPAQAAANARLFPEGVAAHLAGLGALHGRVTLAHGTHLAPRDLEAVARAGARVAHNPGSNLRLRNGVAAVAAMRSAGIEVALGTDDTALADDADLVAEARLADALARRGGAALPPGDALRMLTEFGARAAFLDGAGRIEPGAPADLAAFGLERVGAGEDGAEARLLARLRGADARMTMVGGEVVHDAAAPRPAPADAARIAADVAARTDPARAAAAEEVARALARHYAGARG